MAIPSARIALGSLPSPCHPMVAQPQRTMRDFGLVLLRHVAVIKFHAHSSPEDHNPFPHQLSRDTKARMAFAKSKLEIDPCQAFWRFSVLCKTSWIITAIASPYFAPKISLSAAAAVRAAHGAPAAWRAHLNPSSPPPHPPIPPK